MKKVRVTYYDSETDSIEQVDFEVEAITVSDYSFSFIARGETEVLTIRWEDLPITAILSFIE